MKINKVLEISQDSISDSFEAKVKKIDHKTSSPNSTQNSFTLYKNHKKKGRIIPSIAEEYEKKYEMKIIENYYIKSIKEARGYFLESDILHYTTKLANLKNPVKIKGKLPSIFNNKKEKSKYFILKPDNSIKKHSKKTSITSSDLSYNTQNNESIGLKKIKITSNLMNKYNFYDKNSVKTEGNLHKKCFRNRKEILQRLSTSPNTTTTLRRKFVNKIKIDEFVNRFEGPILKDKLGMKNSLFNSYLDGNKAKKKGLNLKSSFNGYGLGDKYNFLSTSQKKVVKIKYNIKKEKEINKE